MIKLLAKSKKLTGYFEFLLKQLGEDTIRIITPENPDERGCQLSIQVLNANKTLHTKLTEAGVISDWREPDVIRCAPVPLYNSFKDVYLMVEKLKTILNE
jgi:kynureninase